MTPKTIRLAIALLALLIPACARKPPDAPSPKHYALSGHVKLTGYLVHDDGTFAGTKVMGDADGVPVELIYGATVLQRTTTVKGVYHFDDVAAGAYRTRTSVIGKVIDETEDLTVSTFDLNVVDTLGLTSFGDLVPVPNPFRSGMEVYFRSPAIQTVAVSILDLGTTTVRALNPDTVYAGLKVARWSGLDQNNHAVTAPVYWVTLTGDGEDYRAHLIFRDSTSTASFSLSEDCKKSILRRFATRAPHF